MSLKLELIHKHLKDWKEKLAQDPVRAEQDRAEREGRIAYYQAQTADNIRSMGEGNRKGDRFNN